MGEQLHIYDRIIVCISFNDLLYDFNIVNNNNEITHGFWPEEGFYRGGLSYNHIAKQWGEAFLTHYNLAQSECQFDLEHHNVYSHKHYARTFKVLSYRFEIKDYPGVRITGRVSEKKK